MDDPGFAGTERFRVVGPIGSGGMGVVYEVQDLERGERLALKTLKHPTADGVYLLKREFRSLADLDHPGLVKLYDLVVEEGRCFFTMELLEGEELAPAALGGDLARLRAVFVRLTESVMALHAAGRIHRDIKPSNIIVTHDDRVVLLDLGLVAWSRPGEQERSTGGQVLGTAAYMSPEQARADAEITMASDWYSVGVLLYEALVGRPPFHGDVARILVDKQLDAPPSPRALVPSVPADLDALCMALLDRDPAERPRGDAVLRRLGMLTATDGHVSTSGSLLPRFVGREAQLRRLEEAYAAARAGRATVVTVRGPSGMGKSSLVSRFLDGLDPGAVVLSGQCLPHESVPFRALDRCVDGLSRVLRELTPAERGPLLPIGASDLARAFPVLRRVPGLEQPRGAAPADAGLARDRAFVALRKLFERLTAWRPIVIVIEDVQWSDADSAAALVEVLRPPSAPPVLVVLSHREGDRSEILEALAAEPPPGVSRIDVTLGPLSEADAGAIVTEMLGDTPSADAAALVTEAHGDPFLLDQLVRFVRSGAAPTRAGAEAMIAARLDTMPPLAARLLEVIALATGPLPAELVENAADVRDGRRALNALRAARLVRMAGSRVAIVHDRIGQAVVARLDPTSLRRRHLALGTTLEASGSEHATPEALAFHFRAAAVPERAARYAEAAAVAAAEQLAFDRAAEHYAAAMQSGDDAGRARLRPRLAEALGNAGRSPEAAEAWLHAAADQAGPAGLECRRNAAEHFLKSGYVERSLGLFSSITGELGIKVASTTGGAIAELMVRRARLNLRGLKYRARSADEVPPADLRRVDTLATVATCLGLIDNVRGAAVQSSHLLAALAAGEERRVCRALASDVIYRASMGGRSLARAARLADEVESVALRLDDPHLLAWSRLAGGSVNFFLTRFDDAAKSFGEVEGLLGGEAGGRTWERRTAQFFRAYSLVWAGRYREMGAQIDEHLAHADRHFDLYSANMWRSLPNVWRLLALDEGEEALRSAERSLEGWPAGAFFTAHYRATCAKGFALLYLNRAQEARETADRAWAMARAKMMHRMPLAAAQIHWLRALAAMQTGDHALARELSTKLYRFGADHCRAIGALLLQKYDEAAEASERGRWQQLLAAARWRLAGGQNVAARAYFEAEGVRNVERLVNLLAPQ